MRAELDSINLWWISDFQHDAAGCERWVLTFGSMDSEIGLATFCARPAREMRTSLGGQEFRSPVDDRSISAEP
jgi:hypothetical protein